VKHDFLLFATGLLLLIIQNVSLFFSLLLEKELFESIYLNLDLIGYSLLISGFFSVYISDYHAGKNYLIAGVSLFFWLIFRLLWQYILISNINLEFNYDSFNVSFNGISAKIIEFHYFVLLSSFFLMINSIYVTKIYQEKGLFFYKIFGILNFVSFLGLSFLLTLISLFDNYSEIFILVIVLFGPLLKLIILPFFALYSFLILLNIFMKNKNLRIPT
jgi:hypothetical protein